MTYNPKDSYLGMVKPIHWSLLFWILCLCEEYSHWPQDQKHTCSKARRYLFPPGLSFMNLL